MDLNSVTSFQLKAARELLGLTVDELVRHTGVTIGLVAKVEATTAGASEKELEPLLVFFAAQGIEFIARDGGAFGVILHSHPNAANDL